MERMKDVLAVVEDLNYAKLLMRDRKIRTESQFGIFSRGLKVMGDFEHVEFK